LFDESQDKDIAGKIKIRDFLGGGGFWRITRQVLPEKQHKRQTTRNPEGESTMLREGYDPPISRSLKALNA
jgi:hypothetical protein